jgi:hypothetical protein
MICQEIWLMGKADAAETHLPYELGGKSVQNLNHGFAPRRKPAPYAPSNTLPPPSPRRRGSFPAGWGRSSGLILQRWLAAFSCRNAASKLVCRRTVTGPKLPAGCDFLSSRLSASGRDGSPPGVRSGNYPETTAPTAIRPSAISRKLSLRVRGTLIWTKNFRVPWLARGYEGARVDVR